jgi:LSD1 subclass zinc finger protein
MSQAQAALAAGDQRSYYRIQKEFWDFYYRSFPAYLPPSINTDKKYAIYLEICAVSSTESAFDPKWQQYGVQQQTLQGSIRYSSSAEGTKAESTSFFRLAEFFAAITKEGMNSFYRDPKFNIMHELLPEPVHFKMKTSMFAQAWLPYLTSTDADRLLKLLGFSNEYVEIERPAGSIVNCGTCSNELFAPEGSYKVFCETCRKTTSVRSQFFCMSCGSPNEIPENPARPIDCRICGIASRLVQPQFGS